MSRYSFIIVGLGLLLSFGALPINAADAPARGAKLREFIKRFDKDGDGRLNAIERAAAKKFLQEVRGKSQHEPLPQTLVPGKSDLYKFATGPHGISVVETFILHDDKRDKDLQIRLTFPKRSTGEASGKAGKLPLIIFCHGAMGSKDNCGPLVEHWASHGYVIIQPTFGDSLSLMTAEEKRNVKSIVELVNSLRVTSQRNQRPRDVSFVLDSLDLIESKHTALKGRIDRDRIAVAGHSFGAHTSMLITGVTLINPLNMKSVSFREDRVKVGVYISPQGTGKSFTPKSYQSIATPALMITGDNDGSPMRGQEGKAGEWRREVFDHAPKVDKYLLWIKDAHHGFGGINGKGSFPGAGPVSPDQVSLVKTTALAFFDAYLNGDAAAKAYLVKKKVTLVAKGLATMEIK